ncbi:hypothetical protein BTVI_20643 [Pitangus sulphuratus]|nr:hypothetical protein BTVI_20643 [Pitangus sulphuratus]
MPYRGTLTGWRSGLMKFSKAEYKVLNLGWGNPQYPIRLRDELFESNPVQKDLEILVSEKLDMSQKRALASQKANHILGCLKRSTVSRSKKMILPLYSTLSKTGDNVLCHRYAHCALQHQCIQYKALKGGPDTGDVRTHDALRKTMFQRMPPYRCEHGEGPLLTNAPADQCLGFPIFKDKIIA